MRIDELEALTETIRAERMNPEVTEVCAAEKLTSEALAETLSAFANQDNGGFVFFGLNPQDPKKADKSFREDLAEEGLKEAFSLLTPSVRWDFTTSVVKGIPVACAFIHSAHPAARPVYVTALGKEQGSFKRKDGKTVLMDAQDRIFYRAFSVKGAEELRPVLEASVSLLKTEAVKNYLALARSKHPDAYQGLSNQELMETLGITSDHLPTLAGYLIFSDRPQSCFPGLSIMASSITPDHGDPLHPAPKIRMKQITGSIPDMLQETVSFLLTGQKWLTDGEYPMEVVREAILNALLHRDYSRYSQTTPIQVTIYRDRIEITNSGVMKGDPSTSENPLGPNNKTIAEILETLELTRNTGSGIASMKRLCQNANLPEPEYLTDQDSTTVILRRKKSPLKLHPKKEH